MNKRIDYLWAESQPTLKRIEVTIAYGLLDGLCDSIILHYNGKIGYKSLICISNWGSGNS